jgi:HTH-type transcriptional regulator / antitoxin HigA
MTAMKTLKYKVIKSKEQYLDYCQILEELVFSENKSQVTKEEIELLTLLLEKWDEEHNTLPPVDPITLLRALMAEHHLKAKDLAEILKVSKGLVSDILNYKKGLSKEVVRALASHFKLAQEAFNRPYKLKTTLNSRLRNASVMNTPKEADLPR